MLQIIRYNGLYRLFNPYKKEYIAGFYTTKLDAEHKKKFLEQHYIFGLMFNHY